MKKLRDELNECRSELHEDLGDEDKSFHRLKWFIRFEKGVLNKMKREYWKVDNMEKLTKVKEKL